MKNLFALLLIIFYLTNAGCGKKDMQSPDPEPEEQERPPLPPAVAIAKGLGPSNEAPEGSALVLPEGIEWVSETISAVDPFDRDACPCNIITRPNCGTYADELVNLCIQLKNTTPRPIKVTFPAGLLFVSFDTKVQNGMVIQVETFEVPANTTGGFKLEVLCANSHRSRAFKQHKYKLGPVTQVPQVMTLIDFIKNKNLDLDAGRAVAQTVLWDITDGRPRNEKDWRELAELPNK